MAIYKQFTQRNGAQSLIHLVARIEIADGQAVAIINSFATEAAYDSEPRQLNWQEPYPMPLVSVADPDAWLVSDAGPFAGGTVLAATDPLAKAQERRWAAIKVERDRRETQGFPYRGKTIDSDSRSVQRITVAAAAARSALDAGAPFALDWTCADDSVLTLDAEGVVGIPSALALYADELHQVAKQLRARIYAEGVTVESVAAVAWPVPTSI